MEFHIAARGRFIRAANGHWEAQGINATKEITPMKLRWTFGQKIAAGFAVVVVLTLISSLVSVRALRTVVADKDRLLTDNAAKLLDTEKFQYTVERKVAAIRGFLLTDKELYLQRVAEARTEIGLLLSQLRPRAATDEGRALLARLDQAQAEPDRCVNQPGALRRAGNPGEGDGHLDE